jgi:hypothetical protein
MQGDFLILGIKRKAARKEIFAACFPAAFFSLYERKCRSFFVS